MTLRSDHVARINRVLDHIDAHLAGPLDLDTLAALAHFSPFHFHRVFRAMTGETLADRVRRRRLEIAASRLLQDPPAPAARIAEAVGFASAEVFTRSFRARFGMTPTAWRRGGWQYWAQVHQQQLRKIHQEERKLHQAVAQVFLQHRDLWPIGRVELGGPQMNVEVKTLPETRVAYLRHTGPYGSASIARAWQHFVAECERLGLVSPRRTMFGICVDDPDVTPPDQCRYDLAIEVDAGFRPQGEFALQTVRGGRYACAGFAGTSDQVRDGWIRFMTEWWPGSGRQLGDGPAIERYGPDFVMDPQTGAFRCELCVPLRAG